MKVFRHMRDLIAFMRLHKSQRRVVFYSEGKTYWVHLEALLKEFLDSSGVPVCYITSGADDPGLDYQHPNLRSFKIDEGEFRNWLFKNIDTDIMVMTMPDLEQYQVKRSRHPVHYVYVQHSLVSLHMVYRKGAFDYFDSIFCAGPHHIKEVRAIEKKYKLPPKNIVEHGYARLDAILERKEGGKSKPTNNPKKILIAPSWGEESLIEKVGAKIVSNLLENGFHVTLRPHPQTVKYEKDKFDAICKQHEKNSNFEYEVNIASQKSLHESDLMVSDWSGAALDYAFGLGKPVLFIDVPRKVNNPEYESLNIEPFESWIREDIGKVHSIDALHCLSESVSDLLSSDKYANNESVMKNNVFNAGMSANVGAKYLMEVMGGLEC